MHEPIVFVIDVNPIHEDDFMRTQLAVAKVCRELVEDGIQVRRTCKAIRGDRDKVLKVFEG